MWGIDVIVVRKKEEAELLFQKGYLELLGVQLCSFSEVTSELIIGFLALNSLSVSTEGGLSVIQLTC